MARRSEAVDHDLTRLGGVVRRRQDRAHVGVDELGRFVAALRRVQVEPGADLFRRRRQQVQVAERALVAEASELVVADHGVVPSRSVPLREHSI